MPIRKMRGSNLNDIRLCWDKESFEENSKGYRVIPLGFNIENEVSLIDEQKILNSFLKSKKSNREKYNNVIEMLDNNGYHYSILIFTTIYTKNFYALVNKEAETLLTLAGFDVTCAEIAR